MIIPTYRYRDVPAAMDWLCQTLGFERHAVHWDDDGGVAHAQLVLGETRGMIMLSTAREDAFSQFQRPSGAGEAVTSSAYLVVKDVSAAHARARAAGATVVMPLEDQDYGGALFVLQDPEGQIWSVGSYDPWASPG